MSRKAPIIIPVKCHSLFFMDKMNLKRINQHVYVNKSRASNGEKCVVFTSKGIKIGFCPCFYVLWRLFFSLCASEQESA